MHIYWVTMMITPNFRARKGGKERGEVKGEYGRIWGEEEGNTDYRTMVQPSQQYVVPGVKGVEWGVAWNEHQWHAGLFMEWLIDQFSQSSSCSMAKNIEHVAITCCYVANMLTHLLIVNEIVNDHSMVFKDFSCLFSCFPKNFHVSFHVIINDHNAMQQHI